jgi:hypothetical protein
MRPPIQIVCGISIFLNIVLMALLKPEACL